MSTVRRRCVFYVSGFDPKGAPFYHGLYRQQAGLQSALNGLDIDVGPRQRLPGGNSFWDVTARTTEGTVRTHYEFMHWDDVVRAHWPRTQGQLWWKIVTTTLFYLRTGALWKMFELSWPIALAAFMPFLILCSLALAVPLVMALVHSVGLGVTGHELASRFGAVLAAVALLLFARRLEARYSLYWMMRSFAFTARQARGELPDLEQRLDALAQRLVEQAGSEPFDELLVVGHSSGAIMASSVLARALGLMPRLGSEAGQTLSLLTLGQCIPLLALLPAASAFRRELDLLGSTQQLHWLDFSAPPDGCCFPLVDPLASCDVAPRPDRPKLLSPRFAAMFDSAAYQALRDDKLQMHFQYLKASQKRVDYDYFLITAGAVSLAERFAGHAGVVGYAGLRLLGRLTKARQGAGNG